MLMMCTAISKGTTKNNAIGYTYKANINIKIKYTYLIIFVSP